MSLRPAVPGRHGHRPHRYEAVAPRGVHARIDGQWVAATLTGRMQPHDGGRWEVCLEYAAGPGRNVVGWFVEDEVNLRDDERGDDASKQGPPKIDQVPDEIPASLIQLQRDAYAAQERVRAYAAEHPGELNEDESEEWADLNEAARKAALAIYRHPARARVNWLDLMNAARDQSD